MNKFLDRIAMRSVSRLSLLLACLISAALLLPGPSRAAATQEATLAAAAGSADAKFGTGVSISGDTAVAGAPDEGGTPEEGGGMGAAYLFTRSGGTWTEQATLVAPVRTDGDKFGFTVGIDRDTVVVGAPGAEELLARAGAAYVFVRRGEKWAHQATLTPADSQDRDGFGFDVAVSGDTAVVGSLVGAAYVFNRSGEVWTEQAKLTGGEGDANSGFGAAVSISDDTAVVGAATDDVGTTVDQGSAYVFTRTGSTWTRQARLAADDGSPGDAFGGAVNIFRDTVVVSAPQKLIGLNPVQGSAYVFVRKGAAWAPEAKLTAPAPHGDAGDVFGRSVATNGDTVVVGAHFDEEGGGVYVFNRTAGAWGDPTRLTAPGAALLGVSIALSGHTAIAGANFTQVGDNGAQGAAYVYRLRPPAARS